MNLRIVDGLGREREREERESEREMEVGEEGDGGLIRIFVGGLGQTVTTSDLENTFSPLGHVKAVEILRTQGRSFAYMDFHPSSSKALSKLFSLYNGCLWKGGRLRLEMAKEHYLARLRREWAEDAKLSEGSCNDIKIDMSHLEKSKAKNQEKSPLQIYFPRLRKVKSLPYNGTGKHKYSFQRVEVSSLPIHFCDCEEHSRPTDIAGRGYCSTPDGKIGGINDDELHLMSSVMDKLFERETRMKLADVQVSDFLVDRRIPHMESQVDYSADVDILVTNIAMHGDKSRMQTIGSITMLANQEGPAQKLLKSQRKQNSRPTSVSDIKPDNNSLKFQAEERRKDEFSSHNAENKRMKFTTKQAEITAVAYPSQHQLKPDSSQSISCLSWSQRSSWKELVGEKGNGSFSISHILPGLASAKETISKPNNPVAIFGSRKATQVRSVKTEPVSQVAKQGILKDDTTPLDECFAEKSSEDQASVQGTKGICKDNSQSTNDAVDLFKEPKRNTNQEKKRTLMAFGSSEVCTFIRSSNSEKEWTRARSALSGLIKKKSDQTNTSKSSRGS